MAVGRSVETLLRRYGPIRDPIRRQRAADAYSRDRITQWTRMRIEAQRQAGRPPGHEASILKLYNSQNAEALQNLSLDLEGMNGIAHDPKDRWAVGSVYGFLRIRSATIAGGTSELQRNILGERASDCRENLASTATSLGETFAGRDGAMRARLPVELRNLLLGRAPGLGRGLLEPRSLHWTSSTSTGWTLTPHATRALYQNQTPSASHSSRKKPTAAL